MISNGALKAQEPPVLEPIAPLPEEEGAILGRLARHGAWSVIAHACTAASAFVVSVIVARVLGPESFGAYSYYLWLLRLVPYVLAIGIPVAVTKFVAERLGERDEAAAKGTFRMGLVTHGLLAPVAGGVTAWLVWRSRGNAMLAAVMAAGIVLLLLGADLEALLAALRRFRTLGLLAGAVGVGQLVLVVIGALLGVGWEGYLLLQVVGAGLAFTIACWLCRSWLWVRARVPAAHRRSFVRFAGVMAMVFALDAVLWGRPELFFLARYRSDTELGLYSAAIRLAGLASVLPLVGMRAMLPEFSFLRGEGRDEEMRAVYPQACKLMALLGAPLAFGGAAIAGPIVAALYGDAFVGGTTAAAILLAGSFVNTAVGPALAAVLTGPRPRIILEVSGVAAVANVALDILLIPRFGVVAAAAVNVGMQVACVSVGVAYVSVRMRLPYPIGTVGRVTALALPMVLVAAVLGRVIGGWTGIGAAVTAGAVVYVALALGTGTVRPHELRALRKRST